MKQNNSIYVLNALVNNSLDKSCLVFEILISYSPAYEKTIFIERLLCMQRFREQVNVIAATQFLGSPTKNL